MRIYRLSFGALGPFPGRHSIDFQALGEAGLFLIEGPTGTGKSTVIDAISFALYGQVAGPNSSSSADRIVSDFRLPDSDVAPHAELTFEVAAGIFRIHREAAYLKPGNKNLTGPRVRLYRLRPDEIHAATTDIEATPETSLSTVNQQLIELVGLDRKQFAQTIVLPQGDFTAFMRAGSEDRRKLLERLFDTGVYSRIAATLAVQRADAEAGAVAARQRVTARVDQFVGGAALDDTARERLVDALGSALGPLPLVEEYTQAAIDNAAEAKRQVEAAQRPLHAAEKELEERAVRADRVRQRAEADLNATALAEAAPVVAAATGTLEDLERAVVPGDRLGNMRSATQELATRAQALETYDATHPEMATLAAEEAASLADAATREAGELEHLTLLEKALAQRQRELEQKERDIDEERKKAAAAEGELVQLPERERTVASRVHDAETLAGQVEALQAAALAVQTRHGQAAEAQALRADLPGLMEEKNSAEAKSRTATAHSKSLSDRFHASLASVLSAQLQPEHPCPVCGSVVHPAPATIEEAPIDRDSVDAAMSRAEQARAAAVEAAAAVRLAQSRAEELESLAGASVEQLAESAELAEGKAQAAGDAIELLPGLRTQAAAFMKQRSTLEKARDDAALAVNAGVTQIAERQTALVNDTNEVKQGRGEFDTVAARQRHLVSVASAASERKRLLDDRVRAETDLVSAQGKFEESLLRAGFADLAALEAVLDRVEEKGRLAALVAQDREDRVRVSEALARLSDVNATEVVDVASAEQAAADLREAHRAALALSQGAEQVALAARRARDDVVEAMRALDAQTLGSRTLIELANLVNGAGAQNLSLPLFVVRRRFREIVDVANQRLGSMLGGRLSLRAHDEQLDARSKFGLGLLVVDSNSGTERETASLSGGEAFCCALALALGLAEVVSAEQGGLVTEALFIDEGFGSLDQDTLEDVLIELDRLRGEGRMVGVVSHVTEMKERIQQRIQVARVDGRSTLTVTVQ